MANDDIDEYFGEFISETADAVLVDFGTGEEVWVAKSKIEDMDIDDENGTITLSIPEWLAYEVGAI